MCRSQACLQRCGFFQSDAKRSQSFCGHDLNNQQLTRRNPRKPRASCAQAREAPARHLAICCQAARHKQCNTHFPSFRLCPSCVAEPAVLSVGQVCCWPRIAGSDLSGKSLCGLLCERQTHCLEKLARNPHESFANRVQRNLVSATLCARITCASAAQARCKDPILGKGI